MRHAPPSRSSNPPPFVYVFAPDADAGPQVRVVRRQGRFGMGRIEIFANKRRLNDRTPLMDKRYPA